MSVVECKNVCIRYLTGDLKSIGLKEYVMRKLTGTYHIKELWADRNVTFTLEKGDMLGIIGANGAGKSTLLKAISGVMVPVSGSVHTEGNIAALLELASGFDPDMTVKENTYLRGAMLGYTRDFLDQKYDEIIDFAELREFEDYSFKQLSSGMQSRLAFSIACLVDPDLLILDEVLSVGDGAFQQKSSDRMKEILSRDIAGILVSHSIGQIRNLCNKILWLDHGNQVIFCDDTELVCSAYEEYEITRQLPHSREEVERLALNHKIRLQNQEAQKRQSEEDRLRGMLEESNRQAAEQAAIRFLRENCPETLNTGTGAPVQNGQENGPLSAG